MNDGGPWHPQSIHTEDAPGASKLEAYALAAMEAGVRGRSHIIPNKKTFERVARDAFGYAEAMLAEYERRTKEAAN